jgi:Phytanoyl-CoA dioxygenase (PhyH)
MQPWAEAFVRDGVSLIEHALDSGEIERLAEIFAASWLRPDSAGARINTDQNTTVAELRTHGTLSALVTGLAGRRLRLVRVVAFDKTPGANWFVPWHQDRTIALRERPAALPEGYGALTVKNGEVHVEPPVALLAGMVTLRIHLDDCGEDNGPLEVIPGVGLDERLDRATIAGITESATARLCLAARGDILAMRPLSLHRSQWARVPAHRRVLHLEYGPPTLPAGLTWALS